MSLYHYIFQHSNANSVCHDRVMCVLFVCILSRGPQPNGEDGRLVWISKNRRRPTTTMISAITGSLTPSNYMYKHIVQQRLREEKRVMKSWHQGNISYLWLLSWWGAGTRTAAFCSLCAGTGRGRAGCVQPGKLTCKSTKRTGFIFVLDGTDDFRTPLNVELGYLVSGWEATHWRSARALHTLLDWCAVSVGGLIDG